MNNQEFVQKEMQQLTSLIKHHKESKEPLTPFMAFAELCPNKEWVAAYANEPNKSVYTFTCWVTEDGISYGIANPPNVIGVYEWVVKKDSFNDVGWEQDIEGNEQAGVVKWDGIVLCLKSYKVKNLDDSELPDLELFKLYKKFDINNSHVASHDFDPLDSDLEKKSYDTGYPFNDAKKMMQEVEIMLPALIRHYHQRL